MPSGDSQPATEPALVKLGLGVEGLPGLVVVTRSSSDLEGVTSSVHFRCFKLRVRFKYSEWLPGKRFAEPAHGGGALLVAVGSYVARDASRA